MRRLKVEYRSEAVLDLQNVFNFVLYASQNTVTARRYIKRIRDRCDRIGLVPHGGRPRSDLDKGLRTVPFEHSAIIAYKVQEDRIDITNIFYGGRDYDAFYLGTSIEDDDPEAGD